MHKGRNGSFLLRLEQQPPFRPYSGLRDESLSNPAMSNTHLLLLFSTIARVASKLD